MLTIREDDLSGEAAQKLIALHLVDMHTHSPPESVFALLGRIAFAGYPENAFSQVLHLELDGAAG